MALQYTLAGAYEENGQIHQALEMLEQVVKIEEITLSEDHHSRLVSQNAFASAYQENGLIQQAVKLLEQVVKIPEITLSEDHPG